MIRTAAAVVVALVLVASGRGQEPGIRVQGKYTLVISECPFTLHAPAGGSLYFWRVPTGWTITDQGESIIVTQATEGPAAVSVIVATIDFEKKTVDKKTYALSLVVGKQPGPGPDPPPDPQPSPDNPFVPAWSKETGADRVKWARTVAALYDGYAAEAMTLKPDGTWRLTTGKALFTFMSDAYKLSGASGKLPHTVPAVNSWLAGNLKTPEGTLAAADRSAAEAAFLKVAGWLRELR